MLIEISRQSLYTHNINRPQNPSKSADALETDMLAQGVC